MEDIEIEGEYVILLEDAAFADDGEQRFEKAYSEMKEVAMKHGFKFRSSGTEKQMRLMLVDRARFIAEKMKNNE